MPFPAPPARYDLPWKAVLSHAFRPFMDFYFPDFGAYIDWKQRPHFRDKELARMSFGAKPDVMVADKLVEVCLCDGHRRRAMVHIEIQSQRDSRLARRMRDYYNRIGEAYDLPVASLVLLADDDPGWRPKAFRQRLQDTAMGFSFGTAKLLDYAADLDALEAINDPIAWVTAAHRRTQLAHRDPDKLYAAKVHMTGLLFKHRWRGTRIITLLNIVNWMMTLPEPHHRRYLRVISRLEEEHEMREYNQLQQTFIDDGIKIGIKRGLEQGLEQGLERGRQEGLERGQRDGAAALLARLLVRRFGPLPQTTSKKLAKASLTQLEAWSDALAEAQSLRQVFR